MTGAGGTGRRRRGRELALRVLFELEGTDKDPGAALTYQAREVGATKDVVDFARRLVSGSLRDVVSIDATIAAASRWPLAELGKVERAVLRLGTFELLAGDGVPVPVVIDESLELARTYAGEESVQYINGVLGQVARRGAPRAPQAAADAQ